MAKKEKRRAGDRLYHYTYLITDHIHDKYYYGVHSTDFDPKDIEQYHSSSKHLKVMIKELGIDNFSKVVRKYFTSRSDADAWEHKVLRRIKVRTNPKFYNQSEGGSGFVSTGYAAVRDIVNGWCLRVPVDDPYIGILYEYIGKGSSLSDEAKNHLSSLYKGVKWVGEDNPVHSFKDDPAYREKLSKANHTIVSEKQKTALMLPSHWGHLSDSVVSACVRSRMDFNSSINNNKFANIYLYKGAVFLLATELPVYTTNSKVTTKNEPHPLINLIRAGEKYYPSIKHACESLGKHPNTIRNRINSDNDYWSNFHYRCVDDVLEDKLSSLNIFRSEMEVKYKDDLTQQIDYVQPFSVGCCDAVATDLFISSGGFLEGTTFTRQDVKDVSGAYSWFNTYCPLCSEDEYVKLGICSGVFTSKYGNLKLGHQPCRCGDPKNYKLPVLLHHVKSLMVSEGCEFVELLHTSKGMADTKFSWVCRSGKLNNTTRIALYLAKGVRCRCCRQYYKDNPPRIINLKEVFSKRREDYLIQEERGNE